MQKPSVFGADYSVYVRAVRLTLEEKNIDYDLTPIDVFAKEGPPPSYLQRQPFGRIPAFEHCGFRLYETGAITRYIDEAFAGPSLQPVDARQRARANQIISIADSYIYPILVRGVYV
jgi:glutathione S-transferase